jgi:drug/metabolite transporter (DMT)-like permease
MGKKLELPILGAIVVATGGFYMLCLWDGIGSIYLADLLVLLCAISFSFHILSVDRYSGFMNGMLLSMVQFLICGILSGVISLAVENAVVWENVLSAAFPILYTGVMSSGVAYTMQIYGQKYAEPAVASLSMSLESVFAALGGWLILGNALSLPEFIGCALVFLAIVLAQMPQLLETRRTRKKNGNSD